MAKRTMNVNHTNSQFDGQTLCFAGDYVASSYLEPSRLEGALREHVKSSDASVINFEAPVDTNTPQPKYGPVLNQSAEELHVLSDAGFDIVTLANNHIMDHGRPGLNATLDAATKADLKTVGAGQNVSAAIDPLRISLGGCDISIFNACEKEFGMADERNPGTVWIKHPGFVEEVKREGETADLVFVVAHGGIEYVPLPPPSWQRHLRKLAEAGADAIVGHHPHVALPWELHRDTPIFYSLGNFAFLKQHRPETAWSYIVDFEIAEQEISQVGVRLVEVEDGYVRPMKSRDQDQYWKHLEELKELLDAASSNPGYWQETAIQIFDSRYNGRIEDYGNGILTSLLQQPLYAGDRLLRGVVRRHERIQAQRLNLLNYIQNDCHRNVIETALEIKTGVGTDHRTPEIKSEIDEQLAWVNSRANRNTRQRWQYYLREIHERLRD